MPILEIAQSLVLFLVVGLAGRGALALFAMALAHVRTASTPRDK